MINWTLEVEDVACPVDDMIGRKWTLLRSESERMVMRGEQVFSIRVPRAYGIVRARSVAPFSKPAPAKITWSSFENASFAKFGCDLAGPVLKPELPNGPLG